MTTLRDRLLSKVSVDPVSKCWNWTGFRNPCGYGMMRVERNSRLAHRISYELHREQIPLDANVLHRCDNPACVNPDHLFLGTHAENMADRNAKRRQAKGKQTSKPGEAHGCVKLTEADALAIRAAVGVTNQALANQYGISHQQIGRIRSGKRWAHLNG